jgi:DNA-directed RNA polymerase
VKTFYYLYYVINDKDMNTETYLENNPIVEKFIKKVNAEIEDYYSTHLSNLTPKPMEMRVGNKFIKLISNGSVWGFISRFDGDYKGVPIKKGDLMKAASRNAPAKHSRGNIADGTARYGVYGVQYL